MNLPKDQQEKLWGDDGPYSQVNLIHENRILDDKEARKFYYIHVEINPLTYEMIEKNLSDFKDDKWVDLILELSEEREDGNGYNSYPYRMQSLKETAKEDYQEAQKALKECNQAVIRMHKYVIKTLGNLESF